jgi:hypothetical protein
VAEGLRKAFPHLRVEAVTGVLPSDERRTRVDDMGSATLRLLVAIDCLSEGINLQTLFDAVVHYDLSWNPTRHQQREGRVDRFGQSSLIVRSVLLYSPDSAIDGAVLDVILRKAAAIRKATGVTVPLPEERGAVTGALTNAVLLRKGKSPQLRGLAAPVFKGYQERGAVDFLHDRRIHRALPRPDSQGARCFRGVYKYENPHRQHLDREHPGMNSAPVCIGQAAGCTNRKGTGFPAVGSGRRV